MLPRSGGALKTRGLQKHCLKRCSLVLRDCLRFCTGQLMLDVARVLWCKCLFLRILDSLLFIRADQNYIFFPSLKELTLFPTENMTTQKIICQNFFWVLANFLFLVLLFTLADCQQNLANVQRVEALSAKLCVYVSPEAGFCMPVFQAFSSWPG